MMASSNGNIFRVIGPLCGEFTGHRWIPHTKASDVELWCFLWSAPWINGWVNNREAGDLKRHRAHYDVILMGWELRTIPRSWAAVWFLGWAIIWNLIDNASYHMMTSSNENIFRVTGPGCGEFTGHRWIPITKASDADLWCFLWSVPEQTIE